MINAELIRSLRQLNKADKLRVIQLLASEMEQEEAKFIDASQPHSVWSPYDAHDAADVLLKVLKEDDVQGHVQQ